MGIFDRFKNKTNFMDILHSSKWNKANFEEKLDALQKLENHYAELQGRKPCPVTTEKMDDISECGYYNDSKKSIVLNEDHLKSDDYDYLNYISTDTVIHEGYHSFQYRATEDKILAKQVENTDKWKENISVYYEPSEEYFYRFQPLERDTNKYSINEIEKINKQLESKFGTDECYKEYLEDVVNFDLETNEKSAVEALGNNYIEKIDEKIHTEYEKIVDKNKDIDKERKIAKSINIKEVDKRIPLDEKIKAIKAKSNELNPAKIRNPFKENEKSR